MDLFDQWDFINDSNYDCRLIYKLQNFTFDDIVEIAGWPSYKLVFVITKILTIACYCIAFLVGVVGNGLVIWITGFKMKTISAVWFLNLAIGDLLFCVSLPLRITDQLLPNNAVIVGVIIADVIILYISSITSVTFLTVISIDRCVHIMWPFWAKEHCKRRFAIICSIFIWGLSIITVTQMFFQHIDIHDFYLIVPAYYDLQFFCEFADSSEEFEKIVMICGSFFVFGISFTMILLCYCLIVITLYKNKIKSPKRFRRTFRIIIILVISFFICWFPFNLWPYLAKRKNINQILTNYTISSLCLCLVAISSCLNPILYVLLSKARGSGWRKSWKPRLRNTMNELAES